MVPSPQHGVPVAAPKQADEMQAIAQLVENWRTLSPVEREIIVILVASWAAHDARAGFALVQPPARRSA